MLGFQGQRFPESCQRTSLQDEGDGDSCVLTLDIDILGELSVLRTFVADNLSLD